MRVGLGRRVCSPAVLSVPPGRPPPAQGLAELWDRDCVWQAALWHRPDLFTILVSIASYVLAFIWVTNGGWPIMWFLVGIESAGSPSASAHYL